MPQLSRFSNLGNNFTDYKPPNVAFRITPAFPVTGCTVVNFSESVNKGVIRFTSNGTFNLTPNTTFTANVLLWGAGGGFSGSNGGGGGFTSALVTFLANVSYNVVIGRGGTSGAGGGGTGIEFLANANTIIAAGGGGGGAPSGVGGAGGGLVAERGGLGGGGLAATAFSAGSPGALKLGGAGGGGTGFGAGGSGAGGGGGGLYGGGTSPTGGGGGGGGYVHPSFTVNAFPFSLITGNGINAGANTQYWYERSGAGIGGTSSSGTGADGRILLLFVS